MGRDALKSGALRVVADHRTRQGMRVAAYMGSLIEPFVPVKGWPLSVAGERETKDEQRGRAPAAIREMARLAGRLLIEEDTLIAELAKPHKPAVRRRLDRRLFQTRALRTKVEKQIAERAKEKRRHAW